MFMSLFFVFFYIASMTRFVEIFRKLFELRLANYTFFKNKHFELCCFVMYRVHNISPPLTQQPSLNQ
jgi:hypothetical protein